MKALLTVDGFRFELTDRDDYRVSYHGHKIGTLGPFDREVPGVPQWVVDEARSELL
jgi:hypothetical protein